MHKPALFLAAAASFFITIDEVQLKNAGGEWVTVIRPDRRIDLDSEPLDVRFFNNGRIPAGEYANVRVRFTPETGKKQIVLERSEDYAPPVPIKKGTFVGVSVGLDGSAADRLAPEAVKEVRLVADADERVDAGGDKIKIWS